MVLLHSYSMIWIPKSLLYCEGGCDARLAPYECSIKVSVCSIRVVEYKWTNSFYLNTDLHMGV